MARIAFAVSEACSQRSAAMPTRAARSPQSPKANRTDSAPRAKSNISRAAGDPSSDSSDFGDSARTRPFLNKPTFPAHNLLQSIRAIQRIMRRLQSVLLQF